jgi:hypothetical protein
MGLVEWLKVKALRSAPVQQEKKKKEEEIHESRRRPI